MQREPFTIHIAPHEVRVEFVEGLDNYGLWEPDDQRILIRAGMQDSMTLEALMHEVTHAILDLSDVELGDRTKERVAIAMGKGLAMLRRDNPAAMAWCEGLAMRMRMREVHDENAS